MIEVYGFRSIELKRGVSTGALKVLLSDHHWWGGLRVTRTLARRCALWDLGMSMHSSSHLGISRTAMTQVAASIPNLSFACDTRYPWQEEEVTEGGRESFKGGVPGPYSTPGTVRCAGAAGRGCGYLHLAPRGVPIRPLVTDRAAQLFPCLQ